MSDVCEVVIVVHRVFQRTGIAKKVSSLDVRELLYDSTVIMVCSRACCGIELLMVASSSDVRESFTVVIALLYIYVCCSIEPLMYYDSILYCELYVPT